MTVHLILLERVWKIPIPDSCCEADINKAVTTYIANELLKIQLEKYLKIKLSISLYLSPDDTREVFCKIHSLKYTILGRDCITIKTGKYDRYQFLALLKLVISNVYSEFYRVLLYRKFYTIKL